MSWLIPVQSLKTWKENGQKSLTEKWCHATPLNGQVPGLHLMGGFVPGLYAEAIGGVSSSHLLGPQNQGVLEILVDSKNQNCTTLKIGC